jgi:ABC-type glycerol-3-phosphate transport system substrate-binding protein
VKDAFKMGLTYQPKGPAPDGVTAGMANVWGASIHSDARHVETSWDYVKHFAGPEMAQPLWDVGLVPARVDIWEKNSSAPDADPAYKLTMDLFASCKPVCQAWNFRTAEMWTAYTNTAANLWLGKVEPEQGIQDITKAVNEVLDLPAA